MSLFVVLVRLVSYDEFLFAVRGKLNERRAQVILEAFEVMDKDKNGALNASDLKVCWRGIMVVTCCCVLRLLDGGRGT